MFSNYTLEQYLKDNKRTALVAKVETPHPQIKNSRPICVYVDTDVNQRGETSVYFCLFNNGIFVGNSIKCHYDVPEKYWAEIGESMIKELLSKSDFTDLDREQKGLVPCFEFEGVYKSCDECPKFKDKEDGCLGALYSIPTHMNSWEVEKQIDARFGEGTEHYKEYQKKLVRDKISSLKSICNYGRDKELTNYVKDEVKKLLKSL